MYPQMPTVISNINHFAVHSLSLSLLLLDIEYGGSEIGGIKYS